jgi:hypothetical protein
VELRGLAPDLHLPEVMNDAVPDGHKTKPKRSLDVFIIPSPCEEPWNDMEVLGHTTRFCALCSQNVYDISMLTREAAEELIFGSDEPVCGQILRRSDGTVITSDCAPVRFRLMRRTGGHALSIGARLVTMGLVLLGGLGLANAAGFDVSAWIRSTGIGRACDLGHGTTATGGAMVAPGTITGLPRR